MDIADFIRIANGPPPLVFVVIGGHAVSAHGHSRVTVDVDFLVRSSDRGEWIQRLVSAGLKLAAERQAFAQFDQGEAHDGLDLMFVNDETFAKLSAASTTYDFGGETARIPSLDHLIALKLHALKQQLPHRTFKDADDVEVLARKNKLDLRDPRYEEFIGLGKSMKPFSESSGLKHEDIDLELPSEDFRPLPPTVPMSLVLQRCKDFKEWFPKSQPTSEERLRTKVDVEFIL